LTVPALDGELDWAIALAQLVDLGIRRLVVAGGGQLVASLLAIGAIDDLWLTLCPLLLGGAAAPTPVDGGGWAAAVAPRLHLCSVEPCGAEVFVHYRVEPPARPDPGAASGG
jgi:5-amino-6-(5-phosphoribosylamino)uracil reductase